MPNRILKESICVSDSIDQLSWFEEVLFYRLIVNCDDYGRFDGRVAVIKNRLFPLKDNITVKTVSDGINKLASLGLVYVYTVNDKPIICLPTWDDHQSIRNHKSKYPAPDGSMGTYDFNQNHLHTIEINCNQLNANVPVIQSESESESNTNMGRARGGATRFTPPTLEEVRTYCTERKNNVDAERFVDYYESNGWMVGKNRMKSWKAAVRTWEKNNRSDCHSTPKQSVKNDLADLI